MKKKNLSMSFLVIGLLSIALLSSMRVNALVNYGVSEVTHSPELHTGQNLTVEIIFGDDADVDIVRLLICTLSPNFVCEPQPIIMSKTASFTYSADFLIDYDDGTEVGYHIQIIYLNASSILIPDSADFLGMEIVEPITDEFYFLAGFVGAISKTSCCGILGTILAVATSTLIMKKKKKN